MAETPVQKAAREAAERQARRQAEVATRLATGKPAAVITRATSGGRGRGGR